MTTGRPPNNAPALAWDYRRVIELVQVLSNESDFMRDHALRTLASLWKVKMYYDNGKFNRDETIRALARHALEHGREKAT